MAKLKVRALDRNAFICGPKAVFEALMCDLTVLFAPEIEEPKKKVVTKSEQVAAKTKQSEEKKAEIVEFKQAKQDAGSILNVNFSTVGEENIKEFLTEDELDNLIDDTIEKVTSISKLNLDEQQDHIKIITLAYLTSVNMIETSQAISRLKTRDDIVEINTIYKFMNGVKLISSEGAIQMNEFITSQLLYEVITTLYDNIELQNLDFDIVASNIVEKVRKRLEIEIASNGKLMEDEVEPVVPIFFNNSKLNLSMTQQVPAVTKSVAEYIVNYISNIMPEDWVQENLISFEIEKHVDEYTPQRDTGLADLIIKSGNNIFRKILLDLDTVAGNGYSLIVDCFYPDKGLSFICVNIEKFPDIVRRIIETAPYAINDPLIPEAQLQFQQIIQDVYNPEMYMFYDFSGMSKHFAFMTNEDKQKFGMNLAYISQANWTDLNSPDTEMPRMRIRNYKNPDNFTVVSDSNTRQQLPIMRQVIGDNYKKYIKNIDFKDSDIIVCKFKDNKIEVSYNGKRLDNIKLPKKYKNK